MLQRALEDLFHLLDDDNTGFLDAHKFRRMGRAQTGADTSLVQAQMEIDKVIPVLGYITIDNLLGGRLVTTPESLLNHARRTTMEMAC